MDRLFPEHETDIPVSRLIEGVRPNEGGPSDRPLVVGNMISALDGRASLDGRAEKLGGETDLELLLGLRTRFDALLVGAETVRAERYGPVVRDPDVRDRRKAEGMEPSPLTVILTRSGDLPWDAGLFTEGEGPVLVITDSIDRPPDTAAPVEVVGLGSDSIEEVIQLLDGRGIRSILTEGGPHVIGQLVSAGMLDELFLTFTPMISGEVDAPRVVEGMTSGPAGFELTELLTADGDLFTRYRPRR